MKLAPPLVVVDGSVPAPMAVPGPRVRAATPERAPRVVLTFRPSERFGDLVGASPAMRATFEKLRRAAGHDLTILLHGESGTGKELAARAIHDTSARAAGPFVVFDCAAVSPSLVESELFGVSRGAYTGAERAREGVASAAQGGTLLLDEIGELPLDLQPKLLRLLDRHELRRVGESSWRHLDARIIAATHRDLSVEVAAGRFRSDLYHRLAVCEITLPPLRERREDVPLLVRHLLAQEQSWRGELLPAPVVRMLQGYQWPGNVRELRNIILRWLYVAGTGLDLETLATGRVATPLIAGAALPTAPTAAQAQTRAPSPQTPAPDDLVDPGVPLPELRERLQRWFEPRYLAALLNACDGNMSEAGRRAGVARKTLYEMLQRHGLTPRAARRGV